MSKYSELIQQIFSVFNTSEWKSEKIKTVPENFIAKDLSGEFIRISVIPSLTGYNINSISGLLLIEIFVAANEGPSRIFAIADKLDLFLIGKTIKTSSSNKVQFKGSALSAGSNDSDNPTLYRNTYSIPFSYFGVI